MENVEILKQLREVTGVSVTQCQKALKEANNDFEKAKEILRKWGSSFADKKIERTTKQGIIESYIHSNKKLGVLLEIRCETDFVAKSDDFKNLAHELALHIAGMNPQYVKEDEIPAEIIEKEKQIYIEQMANSEKPANIVGQIIEGKLSTFKKESCLLSQPFVKDSSKTVEQVIKEIIAKLGENIVVRRFIKYDI